MTPTTIRAWLLGFSDGWQQPYELTTGRTWEHDQDANEAYDRGVNAGQRVRSPRHHQR